MKNRRHARRRCNQPFWGQLSVVNRMDETMIDLSIRASLSVGAATLAGVVAVALAPSTDVTFVVATLLAAAVAFVAFAAQSRALQDQERLVYRTVPVRRHDVQRRVTFRDE